MKLTIAFNHWVAAMFRMFLRFLRRPWRHCGGEWRSWFQGTEREKNAVREGSDGI
jgi:hypothetical protein